MGRLEIRVCGARNIADAQKVGIPDPYVKVKMGDNKKTQIKYKTRVIENSLNPVWNELVKFQVADEDSTQILFELWNDNILVDDLLGSYHLSLNGLHRGVVKDMWVILTGTKVTSAELHLRVLAVDFGASPLPGDLTVHSIEDDNYAAPAHQIYRPTRRNSTSSQDDKINHNNNANNKYNSTSSDNTNNYNTNGNIHAQATTAATTATTNQVAPPASYYNPVSSSSSPSAPIIYSYPTQVPSPQLVQPVPYSPQPAYYPYSVPQPTLSQNSPYPPPPPSLPPQTTSYSYQPQPMYAPPPPLQQSPTPYNNVGYSTYAGSGGNSNIGSNSTIQYARGVPPPM